MRETFKVGECQCEYRNRLNAHTYTYTYTTAAVDRMSDMYMYMYTDEKGNKTTHANDTLVLQNTNKMHAHTHTLAHRCDYTHTLSSYVHRHKQTHTKRSEKHCLY